MRANRSSSSTGVSQYRRLIEASPTRGAEPGGTPDRSKLFGAHGQRPWLHDVVIPPPILKLGRHGIHVMPLNPGFAATEFGRNLAIDTAPFGDGPPEDDGRPGRGGRSEGPRIGTGRADDDPRRQAPALDQPPGPSARGLEFPAPAAPPVPDTPIHHASPLSRRPAARPVAEKGRRP